MVEFPWFTDWYLGGLHNLKISIHEVSMIYKMVSGRIQWVTNRYQGVFMIHKLVSRRFPWFINWYPRGFHDLQTGIWDVSSIYKLVSRWFPWFTNWYLGGFHNLQTGIQRFSWLMIVSERFQWFTNLYLGGFLQKLLDHSGMSWK